MIARTSHKRWWILVSLLSGATWLAVFGDKRPADGVSVTAQSPIRVDISRAKARVDLGDIPKKSNLAAESSFVPHDAINSTVPAKGQSLELLIPREQLIVNASSKLSNNRDLFASGGWNPPAPVLKPLPPPPPTAPALPFTFLGKKLENSTWEVFLARGEQSFVVRPGTLIEGTYRVDAIIPPNLRLTYLPLGESQALFIGASP